MVWSKKRCVLVQRIFMFVFWQCLKGHHYNQIYSTILYTSKMHSGKYCVSLKCTDCTMTVKVELQSFMILCLDWVSSQPHICSILLSFFLYCPIIVTFQSHYITTNHDCCSFLCAIIFPQSHLHKQQALHLKDLDILVTILENFQLQKIKKGQKNVKICIIKLIYST